MANRTTRTPKKEEAFLDGLRDGKSVSAACLDAGIGRTQAYEWKKADPDFASAWEEAAEEGTDRMEDEAYRRAVHGTTKPIYQGGKQIGAVQEHSDTLMIFMLKARRPDKYRDRSTVALTGDGGGAVEISVVRRQIVDPKGEMQ